MPINTIGVIFCAYNCLDTLEQSIRPWIDARANSLDGRQYIISAVSVPFAEYRDINIKTDDTPQVLNNQYFAKHEIDHLTLAPEFVEERQARNLALLPLLDCGCDTIILVDADEVYSIDQISKIFSFVEMDRFISWFGLSLKNYIFTKDQYLKEPFTPPRIFRVETNGYKIKEIYFDNDFLYEGTIVENSSFKKKIISYKELPSKNIPKEIAWINHYSWLNNDKTRAKVEYQEKRGWLCSYKWDKEKISLAFNENFFKLHNLAIPEIFKDYL